VDAIVVGGGAEIVAAGSNGAAIGDGYRHGTQYAIVTASVKEITLQGKVKVVADTEGGKRPIEAGAIHIVDAAIVATTASAPLFGKAPSAIQSSDLVILYRRVSLEEKSEPFVGLGRFLQLGDVSFPLQSVWSLTVAKSDFRSTFSLDSATVKSFTKTVGTTGEYAITAQSADLATSGKLETFAGTPTFYVGSNSITYVSGARLPRPPAAVRPQIVIKE
jgi:hypothetical protein